MSIGRIGTTTDVTGAPAAPRWAELVRRAEEIGERVLAPNAAQVDVEGRYPREGMRALREAGLLMLPVPESDGGLGSDGSETSDAFWCNRIYRALARACSNTAQVFFVHCMVVRPILRVSGPAQRAFVISELKKGHAFGVAGAEDGKTINDRRTTARRVEGGYRVNGTRTFCTGHGEAGYVFVPFVIPDPAPAGRDEASPFKGVIDLLVTMDMQGVRDNNDWDNVGQRGTTSGSITFEDVFVPDNLVLPTVAGREAYYGLILQIAFSAIYVGMGESALEAGAEYVRTKTRPYPLARVDKATDDPNTQWHVGDMATRLHLAALAVDHASHVMSAAEQKRDGYTRADASIAVQMAKIAATTAALDATQRIFQLMGARSTARRNALDRFWRNARTLTAHDPVDQKYRVVGRKALAGEDPPVTFHT